MFSRGVARGARFLFRIAVQPGVRSDDYHVGMFALANFSHRSPHCLRRRLRIDSRGNVLLPPNPGSSGVVTPTTAILTPLIVLTKYGANAWR